MIRPFKTIIIDDEQPAIQRLLELTANFPLAFEIIGQATNGKEAISMIHEKTPDLIFLDIQMPGMNGFELLQHLEKIPIVIFCTAFDHYSLQAFETNSIDYLMKPVKLERLEQTVNKLGFFRNDLHPEKIRELIKELSFHTARKAMTSIAVRNGSKMIFVKLEEVAYFKSGDKYVSLYTKQGKEIITEQTLLQLEEKLPEYFLRVHRSFILNTQYVKEVQTYFNCRYSIVLNDFLQTKIITGRNYQQQIKKWMDI